MSAVLIDYDVEVPMRDGVVLRADVYRPEGDGPWPVIVARTPYGKTDHYELQFLEPLLAARRGFIAVVQDVRGRFASAGEFVPFVHEAADGYDTVEWASKLPNSTGRVGMWGLSYLGNVQYLAAAGQPPPLCAIAPERTLRTGNDLVCRGGALELGVLRTWAVGTGFDVLLRRYAGDDETLMARIMELAAEADGMPGATYLELPTSPDPVISRHDLPNLADPSSIAAANVPAIQDRVVIPSLHIAGWYDIFSQPTIDNYVAAAERAPARLVVGPWHHFGQASIQGDINFGLAGNGYAIDYTSSILDLTFDWLAAWLAPESAAPDGPPVKIYVMGANEWRSEEEWPLSRAVPTTFLLNAEGKLTSVDSRIEEVGDESATFTHDPSNPVPTLGGGTLLPTPMPGSYDQHPVEVRDDVVLFTSGVLESDLEVTGRVTATLRVETDAPTADWVVRLCDVHPDGRSYNVIDGIRRAEHVPGEEVALDVDLYSTSMVFKAGHRLRVQVTSSCFPRWDRNLNTPDGAVTGKARLARQTVHLGGASYITLPIIPQP